MVSARLFDRDCYLRNWPLILRLKAGRDHALPSVSFGIAWFRGVHAEPVGILLAATSGAFASGVGLLVAFALIVLGMGVPPGLIMALPAQALRPETRAGGMGVYYTWYYAAMAILPTGAGVSRDYAGSAAAPMAFAGVMMILCVVALIIFQTAQESSER